MNHADVVVVGLGAMGSATLYQLAKRGLKAVGIDRFSPPHTFGSTHGDTRLTRQAIGEGPAYTPLALRSRRLWREIEAETGADLLTVCGGLILTSESASSSDADTNDFFDTTVSAARTYGIEHEVLSTDETTSRFPQFRLNEEHRCYYEPGAGFVRPEKAVAAQLQLAKRLGAEIRREERVQRLDANDYGVVVHTDRGRYGATKVVLTAGPWIAEIAGGVMTPRHCGVYRQVLHWFDTDDSALLGPEHMPVYMWRFGSGDAFYGFPAIDGPRGGIKVATPQYVHRTDPNDLNREVHPDEAIAMYEHCVKGRLPILPSVVKEARCLYTSTSDHDFIIDRHPEHHNVVIASPCSGHGFKHSAAIGESLAQLTIEGQSEIDLSPFSLSRFGD